MALYEWKGDSDLALVEESTFESLGIEERANLQHMVRDHIEIIDPDLMVVAEEFGDWEDSRRRIDLLCIDKEANLVVVELKRTEGGGHMELQAIRYAAMVSAMTFDRVVEAHAAYLKKRGLDGDARESILEFLSWEEAVDDDFAQEVHIVLVSQNFSSEITTAVLWLNQRDLDIRCIRLTPHKANDGLFLSSQQVIPLPEEEDFRVSLREKGIEERRTRSVRRDKRQKFWAQMLPRANKKTQLHSRNRPGRSHYISANAGKPGLGYVYAHTRNGIQAELYIDTGDRTQNKSIFDLFHESRPEIEKSYGGELAWDRLDHRRASRITTGPLGTNGYQEEESLWEEIQEEWINQMIRLDNSLRPHIDGLKK